MATLEIIGTEKGFSMNPLRQGKLDRFVTYRREDQTLGFAVLPDETFTITAAQAEITKLEQERRLTTPIRFTIP